MISLVNGQIESKEQMDLTFLGSSDSIDSLGGQNEMGSRKFVSEKPELAIKLARNPGSNQST